ncbi:hypothetical protein NQ315_017046 [Exocentrus adspersus]|uniref:Uncharacterized protein n=1 Tax=Exocentrus adspersus TaxID=1586481 RepID=A0AAV8V8L3_9CUCU|nr:hypothetical protein NQ315_017046 [Exocentrus adspersus]
MRWTTTTTTCWSRTVMRRMYTRQLTERGEGGIYVLQLGRFSKKTWNPSNSLLLVKPFKMLNNLIWLLRKVYFHTNLSTRTISLMPPREDFYSSLNESSITEDEYKHAQRVWDAFKCTNLAEYSDIYLKTRPSPDRCF